ncbi:hypothetical protein BJ508DRAFT_347293 [Ascobolus immersus RN42]|uniref:Uncharacterized protein n=1 Tax=Ascobolus immersus RN42 TaxID=1160509 RepID=A0A3N4I4P4_ASCIM|nr:hypothetical protein BJ508DRAFT_347293 [Ascobolus immersus RN42]
MPPLRRIPPKLEMMRAVKRTKGRFDLHTEFGTNVKHEEEQSTAEHPYVPVSRANTQNRNAPAHFDDAIQMENTSIVSDPEVHSVTVRLRRLSVRTPPCDIEAISEGIRMMAIATPPPLQQRPKNVGIPTVDSVIPSSMKALAGTQPNPSFIPCPKKATPVAKTSIPSPRRIDAAMSMGPASDNALRKRDTLSRPATSMATTRPSSRLNGTRPRSRAGPARPASQSSAQRPTTLRPQSRATHHPTPRLRRATNPAFDNPHWPMTDVFMEALELKTPKHQVNHRVMKPASMRHRRTQSQTLPIEKAIHAETMVEHLLQTEASGLSHVEHTGGDGAITRHDGKVQTQLQHFQHYNSHHLYENPASDRFVNLKISSNRPTSFYIPTCIRQYERSFGFLEKCQDVCELLTMIGVKDTKEQVGIVGPLTELFREKPVYGKLEDVLGDILDNVNTNVLVDGEVLQKMGLGDRRLLKANERCWIKYILLLVVLIVRDQFL